MAGDSLPSSVRQFISQHLSSVEQLEILLLLANQTRAHWTAEDIYMVVLSSRTSVVLGLDKFTAAGLLEKSDETSATYRLSSDAPVLNELRHCYQEMPVRVIEAIYQRNRDAVQGFADAFKFKREP